MGEPRPLFGAAFWRRFVSREWNRAPAVFPRVTRGLASVDMLFAPLVTAAERERQGHRPPRLRFYGDGTNLQIREDFERLLPTASDRSMTRYAARVTAALGTTEWGVVLNALHCDARPVWELARALVQPLFQRVGWPGGHVSVEAFVGPYASTPFAIHKDEFHVFTVPLLGRKHIELWPFDTVARLFPESPPRELDVVTTPWRHGLPGDAAPMVLEAVPGDLMYWPPDHWHIGRGTGELNVTLAIAVGMRARASDALKRLSAPSEVLDAATTAGAHAKRLRATSARLAQRLASKRFARQLEEEALRRVSGCCFEPPVTALPLEPLGTDEVVRVDPRFPLLTLRRGAQVSCFLNGHVATVAPAVAIERLVARLNRGSPVSVASVLRSAAADFRAEGYEVDDGFVRQFLETCVSVGSLMREKTKPTPRRARSGPQKRKRTVT